jgi:glycerophosphoryl diester phosphodiesterase
MTYGEGSAPLAIARGGAALAQENSIAAFTMASALGFRYLETDIRVTRDGRLVCFHDDTLERVASATGLVRVKSSREVRSADPRD